MSTKRQLIAGKKSKKCSNLLLIQEQQIMLLLLENGIDIPAICISRISDLEKYEADVYCIDEFQFLKGNVKVIEQMADCGKKFFIAGLNLTAEKKPFGKMADLLCISDNVHMLSAICDNCKNENAVLTYYKGGKDTDIVIGDRQYMALCRHCYDILTRQDELNKSQAQA